MKLAITNDHNMQISILQGDCRPCIFEEVMGFGVRVFEMQNTLSL
jgi:hypothetical protein